MMPELSVVLAPEVVVMTNSVGNSHDKVGSISALGFQKPLRFGPYERLRLGISMYGDCEIV